MLFNSYVFIFALLPVSLLLWYLLNKLKLYTVAKLSLIAASLVFYAYFNWSYSIIILSSIALNYLLSRVMLSDTSKWLRKTALFAGIFGNLGVLGYFKYFDFFLLNLNIVFKADFMMHNIVLPLGISFFTFQQLSYVIDSYKQNVPKYNILDYSLFVTFFPQLVAGPIVLHSEIVPQFADISKKKFNVENFGRGMMAFSLGLAKKVLIADSLGIIVNYGYDSLASLSSLQAVFTMLSYTFQIYFDFSGYCDMATGIGLMFNIELPMNFNSPYKSLDIHEFWKRWHITLTRFFTNYIYFPLGGNRKGKARTYFNIMVVFLASGLWHGAGYTFIIWGALHGIASVINRIFAKPLKKVPKLIRWFVCFVFLNLTWVIFRAESIGDAFLLYKRVFAGGMVIGEDLTEALNPNILNNVFFNLGVPHSVVAYILVLLVCSFILSVFFKDTNDRINEFRPNWKILVVSSLALSVSILSLSGVSTFLYFNF